MKILVLGGTGMVGHTISIYLKELGYDITIFSRNKINYCKNINKDITNFDETKKIIENNQYNIIINSIGILNQYAENNKSIAILLNSYLPHFLSDITRNIKTKIIHISTDCVFSGKVGKYTENSFKDAESFYGKTKALGEIDNNKDITIRSSLIGSDMNINGIGLFNWFMKQNGEINGFTNVIWTGITTLTLAKSIEQIFKEDINGIYNLVNNEIISKYELLNLFNKYMKNNSLNILPNKEFISNKSLINNRIDFSFKVPDYETMIIEMKEWIYNHKEFYPHYFL